MPRVELSAPVKVPASLIGPELLRLLDTVARNEAPHADFAISTDLSAFHLPNIGTLSVPVAIKIERAPSTALRVDFSLNAKENSVLFPAFTGSLRSDPDGPSASTVWLVGEYVPPLGYAGMVLDHTLLNTLAVNTLTKFLETLVAAAQPEALRRERESLRSERFNR